jgi:hypothetical protein
MYFHNMFPPPLSMVFNFAYIIWKYPLVLNEIDSTRLYSAT